jgi:hypothetical protein
MQRSGNQGVRKYWIAHILAEKCQGTIARREPGLPAKDAEARGRELSGRIIGTLVARGILTADGYNPSGLKKGVTTKMTPYGQAALGHASVSPGVVTPMDPVKERILSAERAISKQYPDGSEQPLSDIVALFQDLKYNGEIEQHTDLLTRCNEHATMLGESLENKQQPAIVAALALAIEGFRLISSLL